MWSHALRTLAQVCLWLAVLISSPAAAPNRKRNSLDNWIGQCNCPCLSSQLNANLILSNCTTERVYRIFPDGRLKLLSNYDVLRRLDTADNLRCKVNFEGEKKFKVLLFNLSCTLGKDAINGYVVYKARKQSRLDEATAVVSGQNTSSPSGPTQTEEKKSQKSMWSKTLIIALSIGLAIMTTTIICSICICCCKRKKHVEKKEDNQETQSYIDEVEDSAPYRIVDLQTNISCDARGYTFLDASKKEEEKPYQKLQPKQTEKKDIRANAQNNNDDFEEVVEEPVYFLLEEKQTTNGDPS